MQLEQLESGRLDEALLRNLDQSTQVLSKLVGIDGAPVSFARDVVLLLRALALCMKARCC